MAQNMEPVLTDFIWNKYQGKKKITTLSQKKERKHSIMHNINENHMLMKPLNCKNLLS